MQPAANAAAEQHLVCVQIHEAEGSEGAEG